MKPAPARPSSIPLIAAATSIGTAIESYDFYIYGFAAALVFPALFFPESDPFAAQLASYGIFWVGFLSRPLGGVIFGHFGDRIGRKAMLVVTLAIMGVATFLVGLLPTYSRIGFWAPVLLVVLRLCQGIAVGGEWGGAVLMAAEHAQARNRGLVASSPQIGVPLGLILAIIAFSAITAPHVAGATVAGAAWRIPFLLSIVLVAIGLGVRMRVAETPPFERMKAQAALVATPILSVLRDSWKTVLLSAGSFLALSGGFFLVTTQILSYGAGPQSTLKLAPHVFFLAILLASVMGLLVVPLGGWLSDRLGRRPVFIAAMVCILVWAFPMYALIDSKDPRLITVAVSLFMLPAAAGYGALAAMSGELFRKNVRYSGISLGFNLAAICGGGLAPLLATLLLKLSGNASWVLAAYLATMTVVSLVCAYALAETRHADLSA